MTANFQTSVPLKSRKTRPVVSAGGVVLRVNATGVTECLVVKRAKGIDPKWKPTLCQLPKGGVEKEETLRVAALREVLEETGFAAEIIRKAGTASWTYQRGRIWLRETVHYYLMRLTSAAQQPHDSEFEEVCWSPVATILRVLSYPEERQLLREVMNRELLCSK